MSSVVLFTRVGVMPADRELDEIIGRSLRKAIRDRLTVVDAAKIVGVSAKSFHKWLNGEASVPAIKVMLLAQHLGRSVDELLAGIGPESGDWGTDFDKSLSSIPLYDIRVSAGGGAEHWDERPIGMLAFKDEWLQRRFSDPDRLAIFRVDGDSMEPELRHEDLLMVDQAQAEPRDGLFVVRIDQQLLVKRLQVAGRDKLILTSANPAYAPIEIDTNKEKDGFAIIGKGVWIGRNI